MKNVKFRGKREDFRGKFRGSNTAETQIPRYFRGPRKTVGPTYDLFRHSLQIYRFSLLFFYKVTTTAAQFTFYNGKLQFTTAEIVSRYTLKYALANYGTLGHVPSQVLEILCILQLLRSLTVKFRKLPKKNMYYIFLHLAVSVLGNRNMNAVSKRESE